MINAKRVIRVLVVDDSAFMRRAIAKMLTSAEDIVVVGSASTGEEGIAMALDLKPDIMTMDIEMPGIGGLEAARTIVARGGPPIIMISSLTQEGAQITLRALEIGVVDFIPKPDSAAIDILRVKDDLIEKVREFGSQAAASRRTAPGSRPAATIATISGTAPARPAARACASAARVGPFECVALGTSTGGPVALGVVLPKLPANFPLPILVVQHMPPGFTKALAQRLNAASQITVVEGENGMLLANGTAIIAPAGRQLTLRRTARGVEIRLDADTQKSLHVPSVDILAAAVGELFGRAALGVILTGMGHDGVAGLAVIKKNGGYVIGQDEASSVVYGMPRAAAVAGLVDRVVSLGDVARALCEAAGAAYLAR
jgi:two-component system chemotaxis response regulator CheB